MELQERLSDFGNVLVASAGASVILAWLWGRIGWVAALVYLICFLGVVGSVVGLKVIAFDLRPPVAESSVFGLSEGAPSGHAAMAMIVYGALAAILPIVDRRRLAWLGALVCLGVMAAVAITRVTLDKHTVGDVIAGVLVAGIGVTVFARALRVQVGDRTARAGGLFVAVAAVTVLLLVSGARFNALAAF